MPIPRTVVATAPGRVNLIGEHTDYNGGLCLPFAIPLATTATVTRRDDDQLVISSAQAPGGDDQWKRYVEGVVLELRALGWPVPALTIHVDSTIPLGGGLSSSAALECAVGTAIAGIVGHDIDDDTRRTIAEAARRAETIHVGAPTGGMDQLASMLGARGQALLINFSDATRPTTTRIPLPVADDGLVLLVSDTHVRHSLADGDGGYAQRRRECEVGDPRRLRHVTSENQRVRDAVTAIQAKQWIELGNLITASHTSLCDDFEVSTVELDITVETALEAGALGSRMTGGGFGGCTISLVAAVRTDDVQEAINAAYNDRGWQAPTHHVVTPSAGARLH